MEKSTAEKVESITPQDAVADAVMAALYQQIKGTLAKQIEGKEKQIADPETLLKRKTYYNCYSASAYAIHFLAEKYDNLFRKYILLSTDVLEDDSILIANMLGGHTSFLAEGVDGTWYAASPANHAIDKNEKYALEIVSSQNLEETIRRLEQRDGATYPSPEVIEESLNSPEYSDPQVTREKDGIYSYVFELWLRKEGLRKETSKKMFFYEIPQK